MMWDKMTMVRKRKEYHEKRAQVNIRIREKRKKKQERTPEGLKVVETWEVSGKDMIQDDSGLVIMGADVAASIPA